MFATLRVPDFPLAAVLRRAEHAASPPCAVAVSEARRSIIVAADPEARCHGVSPGMTSTRALARCSSLRVLPVDSSAEESLSSWLLALASSVSPRVECLPGVVVMDLNGCRIVERMGESIVAASVGVADVRIGISDTIERSMWAAHRAEPVLVSTSEEELFGGFLLEDAPIPSAVQARLWDWGLRDLLDFVRLPRDSVARRLGGQGLGLWEELKGRRTRLLRVAPEEVRFRAAMDLEHPVETLEQALFVIMRLLKEVCATLNAAVRVASTLQVRWCTVDRGRGGRDFIIPEPTAREKTLFAVIESYFSGVRTNAALSFLEVEALAVDPAETQRDFFEIAARDPGRFREVVGRVQGYLGEDCFGVPVCLPTYHPDGFRVDPPSARIPASGEGNVRFSSRFGPALRRFRPPRVVKVRCRDGRPAYCSCEEGAAPVLQCRGPFRRSGEWWEPPLAWSREEWDVEWPVRSSFRRLVRISRDQWEWDGLYD